MNFQKVFLACLCTLVGAIAHTQRGFVQATSTNGWDVTVVLEYRNIRITDAKDDCRPGFNYVIEMDYEVTYSDNGSRRMYWMGAGGGCFTENGEMTIPERTSMSGTFDSPTKWISNRRKCDKVDYSVSPACPTT